MNWTPTLFADLILETKDGEWGESYQRSGYQLCEVIRGTDFSDLNSPNRELPLRWIADQFVERKQLMTGDILIETAGGTAKQSTGRTALITLKILQKSKGIPLLCSSFARHLRVDKDKCNPVYLYYLLQTLYRAGYMGVFNLQHTGISRFQFTAFKNKTVLMMPPLAEQQKIAVILIAYDDLIANNQRRIALLESMAEEIYREWFVRMRFPGYRSVKTRHGVPENWVQMKLGSILELRYGKALKEESRIQGKYLVYGSGGIVGTHNEAIVKTPGLVVGRKGNVGSIYYADRGFFPIDTVFFVNSNLPNSFLYFLLRSMNFINNDAAVPGLNREQAYANELYLPPVSLIDDFVKIVDPLFEQLRLLVRQNEKLADVRNTLLPRLISGKLKVNHLDIQFPPSMREDAAA